MEHLLREAMIVWKGILESAHPAGAIHTGRKYYSSIKHINPVILYRIIGRFGISPHVPPIIIAALIGKQSGIEYQQNHQYTMYTFHHRINLFANFLHC